MPIGRILGYLAWNRRVSRRKRKLRARVEERIEWDDLDFGEQSTLNKYIEFVARTPRSKFTAAALFTGLLVVGAVFVASLGPPLWFLGSVLLFVFVVAVATWRNYRRYRRAKSAKQLLVEDPQALLAADELFDAEG